MNTQPRAHCAAHSFDAKLHQRLGRKVAVVNAASAYQAMPCESQLDLAVNGSLQVGGGFVSGGRHAPIAQLKERRFRIHLATARGLRRQHVCARPSTKLCGRPASVRSSLWTPTIGVLSIHIGNKARLTQVAFVSHCRCLTPLFPPPTHLAHGQAAGRRYAGSPDQ